MSDVKLSCERCGVVFVDGWGTTTPVKDDDGNTVYQCPLGHLTSRREA